MNKDLTVGKPSTVLWKYCLPLFASVIFQQLYNIADSFVAGKFIGEHALAAVGNSYEITLIFIAFGVGCNIGCSVIVSRLFGAKDYSRMKSAVYTTFISSAVLCLVLMLVGIFFGKNLLNLIHTPSDIFNDSWIYLEIYVYSLPFVIFYNVATGIFSALGDSQTPFIFLACSSVSNIFMDILFVTAFDMGVAGVAWATLICQGISCLLALYFVFKRFNKIKTEGKVQIFSLPLLRDIAVIAIPSILQQSFISVGNIIIQGIINTFGTGIMAGYAASVKLNNLVLTSLTTIGNGISNYTSQNIGAKKPERVKDGFAAGVKLVLMICIPIILLYTFGAKFLVLTFLETPSNDALSCGMLFLRIVSPFYLAISVKLVADGVLRGAGKMTQFMCATFSDLFLRVILAKVLSDAIGSNGIWLAWPIGWCVATVLSVIFYKNCKFGKKVKEQNA